MKHAVRRCRRSAGFTLIELLVVAALIALLGVLLLPRIIAGVGVVKEGVCKQNMLVAAAGLEMYRIERGDWPDDVGAVKPYVGEEATRCPLDYSSYSWDGAELRLTCGNPDHDDFALKYDPVTGKFVFQ